LCGRKASAGINKNRIEDLQQPREALESNIFEAIWTSGCARFTLHSNVKKPVDSGDRNIKFAAFLDIVKNMADGLRYGHGFTMQEIGEVFLKGQSYILVINALLIAIRNAGRSGGWARTQCSFDLEKGPLITSLMGLLGQRTLCRYIVFVVTARRAPYCSHACLKTSSEHLYAREPPCTMRVELDMLQ